VLPKDHATTLNQIPSGVNLRAGGRRRHYKILTLSMRGRPHYSDQMLYTCHVIRAGGTHMNWPEPASCDVNGAIKTRDTRRGRQAIRI